jgi:hypothetical protein
MTVEEHNVSTTRLLEVSSEDRYGFKADFAAIGFHVRFTPKSGHSAALPMIFVRALCTASQQNGSADVRFGSYADMAPAIRDVRFTPKSGHCQRFYEYTP